MSTILNPMTPENSFSSNGSDWISNTALFWDRRRFLVRVATTVFILSIVIVLLLPKQYESSARIMPPEQPNSNIAMLAALAGRGAGGSGGGGGAGLAGFAGSLLGIKNSSALFIALLRSGTVSGKIIERFNLQNEYHNRYRVDTAKRLARLTDITEDAKSGVIKITVTDKNPYRARDLAQAYLDELNSLVAKVNTSSAHRERLFIEQRLRTVQNELQQAQIELSNFSRENTTIDIKEQTRAMVDAGAKLQGQLIVGESELDSLRQIYGDKNMRVRAVEARNSVLRRELERESGQNHSTSQDIDISDAAHPYPALRQLPQLGIRWANLYRTVRIHETVFDLLSEEYESARIDEEKSIPSVSVIDFPGVPEKKSGPHRVLIVLGSTLLSTILASLFLMSQRSWNSMDSDDRKKMLFKHLLSSATKS